MLDALSSRGPEITFLCRRLTALLTENGSRNQKSYNASYPVMKGICPLILLATVVLAQKAPIPLKPGLYATFNTSKGAIIAVLYEKDTPASVKNFVELAQGTKAWRDPQTGAMVTRPMYDNITFHRVLRGQMIQSGDPTGSTAHDCGVTVPDELLLGLQFDRAGRLAVANSGTPNSGGCQFFITDDLVRSWNQQYTIFGQVVSGMEVVDAISHAPLHGDKPVDPVKLISVIISRVGPEPADKRKKEK
jgi:peptidyl-prolyl cis-trans isomerase A (cyclophilin A)